MKLLVLFPLVAALLLAGCESTTTTSSASQPEVHGDAGVTVKSAKTSRISPGL